MDEKEVANLGENLLNRRETREKALNKSEEELSKIDQRKDPQAYAECQEEIRRRKEELESIKEDIEIFNELQEKLKKLNVDKKKNEFNEKSENLKKAQNELSKIDQRKDPQAYAECQEEIRRRQEEFDDIKSELNEIYKNKSSIESNLKTFIEKYNIDQSKKHNDTADTREDENSVQDTNVEKNDEQDPAVNKELEEKRRELSNLRKSILANGGNITPEQVDKIKKLQQEIKDLKNGKNVQQGIEDKHKDQQRIEDKHNGQQRIEDKHKDQLRIEDKHKDQLRIEDKHKDQLRIEDKHNGQLRIEDKHKPVGYIGMNDDKLPVEKPNTEMGLSFFEVVAKTDTEHIGNMEGKLHSLAHSPIFQTGIIKSLRAGDPIGAITGAIPKTASSIIMLGPKLVSKAVCVARGTNKKFKKLQENIDNLSPEEFDILVGDNSPLDYSLNATTMVQFKFNDKYLEAINSRVQRERRESKAIMAEQVGEINQQMDAINKEISSGRYSDSDKKVLVQHLTNLSRQKNALENEAQKEEGKRLAFEDGMELKSSRKKNIPGWIAAIKNPNNIMNHKQMAEYSRIRREARANGDYSTELEMDEKLDKYISSQTSMKMSKISRGNYQKADIESGLSRENQTKGMDTIRSMAIVSSILVAARAVEINQAKAENQSQLNQQIDQHNQDINQHNQNLQAQNEEIVDLKSHHIDDKTVNGAVNYQKYADSSNIRAQGEVQSLNDIGAQTNKGWAGMNDMDSPIDDAIHMQQHDKIQQVPLGSDTQTYINEINNSVNKMARQFNDSKIAEQAYQNASGHADFDVTQYMDSTQQGMNYSQYFQKFFSDALKQNDAVGKLSATPVTLASPMGDFTINIPSVLIPSLAALSANLISECKRSGLRAEEVMKKKRQQEQPEQTVAGKARNNKEVQQDVDDVQQDVDDDRDL